MLVASGVNVTLDAETDWKLTFIDMMILNEV